MSLFKRKMKILTSPYKRNTIYSSMKEQEMLSTIINELNEIFIKEHNLGRTMSRIRNSLVKQIKLRKQSATKIYNHLSGNHESKPELTCLLGWFNLRAIGTNQNLDEAFNLFTKSASQHYALGQFYLAICYEQEIGIAKDELMALFWYQKAAENGETSAQVNLGLEYELGTNIEKDYNMATKWYQKAAENGHLIAMYNLGRMYEHGFGVEKNFDKAFKFMNLSAQSGYPNAALLLGNYYLNGKGCISNLDLAFKYFKIASKKNVVGAQYVLAIAYEEGQGKKEL